jgi:hypothetical protein
MARDGAGAHRAGLSRLRSCGWRWAAALLGGFREHVLALSCLITLSVAMSDVASLDREDIKRWFHMPRSGARSIDACWYIFGAIEFEAVSIRQISDCL